MKKPNLWRDYQALWVGLIVVLILIGLAWRAIGTQAFIRTTLSGLTLSALFFMVAAGLTLVFGLMDVLNFAQGSMFMLGAYVGWQFYTNPTFLFGLAPLITAFIAGLGSTALLYRLLHELPLTSQQQRLLRAALITLALALALASLWKYDVRGLAKTAMVSSMVAANPLAEASPQEPLARFWLRPFWLFLSGLTLAAAQARPGDETHVVSRGASRRSAAIVPVLLTLTIAAVFVRESGPVAVLLMHGNARFVLALATSLAVGFGLGVVVENLFISPLYSRPLYQIIITMGLAYVIGELVQLLWDPLPYAMDRPPLFAQPGKAAHLMEWLQKGSSTIDIFGVTFPTYRLFIIVLGVVMFLALTALMKYSRLGMIIRAGVQDREMVEALGINVKRVFTLVFALGTALAALGGIGAAPFMPVEPVMGDRFLMQGFITVVIGGMGSTSGAGLGALLLGLARAFGDYLALKYGLTPSISEASTVIIMAIVLLARPAGLLGKKD